MDQDEFNRNILSEMSNMNKLLTDMNENMIKFEGRVEKALAETNGKLKGNYELITQEFHSYVSKDVCESHRTKQGSRMGDIEKELSVLRNLISSHIKDSDASKGTLVDILISWGPGILKILILGVATMVSISNGWITIGV